MAKRKDKLSVGARCVATLAVVVLADDKGRLPQGLYRVLASAASDWDSTALHIKWRAYGALQGAIDVLSCQDEWGSGPEGHGWALCDFAQDILNAESAEHRDHAIDRAEAYLIQRLGVEADLRAGSASVRWLET